MSNREQVEEAELRMRPHAALLLTLGAKVPYLMLGVYG